MIFFAEIDPLLTKSVNQPIHPDKTIAISALGCQVNQAEVDELWAQLAKLGYQRVELGEPATVTVVNTCTVTHVADRKSRQLIRRARRASPEGIVIVTGCYAQRARQEIQSLGSDLVIDNLRKDRLNQLVEEELAARGLLPIADHTIIPFSASRTRAQIKVQDGCQHCCTFCVIPYVRGPERSVAPEEVVNKVQAAVAAGHREAVLTGVQIGAYGREWRRDGAASSTLTSLVERILAETEIERIRLSSIEPEYFEPGLLELLSREPRLCPHLHLPAQSGSDQILKRMGRRYTRQRFLDLLAQIRDAAPDASIATDIMVGFPGETEEDFNASCRLVEEAEFSKVHVFPYSPRPGTPAARMPDQVAPALRAERCQAITALAEQSAGRFRERFLGRTMAVLYEDAEPDSVGRPVWSGLTPNGMRVYTAAETALSNRIRETRLVASSRDGLIGELA